MRHRVVAYLECAVPTAGRRVPRAPGGAWRWLFADAAGVAVPGPPVCFTSEQVAEKWLASQCSQLRDIGLSAVTLLDGEHAVYGPASLPAA
jgi:hypothetical protein